PLTRPPSDPPTQPCRPRAQRRPAGRLTRPPARRHAWLAQGLLCFLRLAPLRGTAPAALLAGLLCGLPLLRPRRLSRRHAHPLALPVHHSQPLPRLLAPALRLRRVGPSSRGWLRRGLRGAPGLARHRIARPSQGGLRRDLHRVWLHRPPPRAAPDVAPRGSPGSTSVSRWYHGLLVRFSFCLSRSSWTFRVRTVNVFSSLFASVICYP
ncbi:putative beta-13-galactosyltransferase 14, partial [Zea mays]